jgi:GNAT superfamily N-acetyltransferase
MLDQNVLKEYCTYLKKVLYKGILQNLKLEYCTDDGEYIHLILIVIKRSQRNKGYGSLIMSDIIKFANEHNVRIKLWATAGYGSDIDRLNEFYKKLGFILEKNNNILYHP